MIKIPHINFVKEKSPDFADVQSNLRLLFCIMKQLQSTFGFNVSPFSLIFVAFFKNLMIRDTCPSNRIGKQLIVVNSIVID